MKQEKENEEELENVKIGEMRGLMRMSTIWGIPRSRKKHNVLL